MTPLPETHDPGPISVIRSICLQAMVDYFILYRMGAVKRMESTGYFKPRPAKGKDAGSLVYQSMTPSTVTELLEFFENDMHKLVRLLGHHITPLAMRERMIELEETGEWRNLFGQGIRLNPFSRNGPEAPLNKPPLKK